MSTTSYFQSSVFRKQIVAITGLILVLFILFHLAGNLIIFLGPEHLNQYSEMLHALPELLWVARLVLLGAVGLHIYHTVRLYQENRKARGEQRYAVEGSKRGDLAFARKWMILTGLVVIFFLVLHLYDFTFTSHHGDHTVVPGAADGEPLGLFGLVWNSFGNPLRGLVYIAAMACVGLHLSHGIQSLFQSMGWHHNRWMPLIMKVSVALGFIVAIGFSLIPIYILLKGTPTIIVE